MPTSRAAIGPVKPPQPTSECATCAGIRIWDSYRGSASAANLNGGQLREVCHTAEVSKMRFLREVIFTAARKRNRQAAEDCPTSVTLETVRLRSVGATERTNRLSPSAAGEFYRSTYLRAARPCCRYRHLCMRNPTELTPERPRCA